MHEINETMIKKRVWELVIELMFDPQIKTHRQRWFIAGKIAMCAELLGERWEVNWSGMTRKGDE